jgi:hypothetical protein
VGAIAERLSQACPATAQGDGRLPLGNRINLTEMIDNLNLDTWIEGDDQGAMLPATDRDWGTHQHSFFGVVQQENTSLFMIVTNHQMTQETWP